MTGTNIASQDLLFKQLSDRLKVHINGPVITLLSGDASNLKTTLKKLIRDATNQGISGSEDNGLHLEQDVGNFRTDFQNLILTDQGRKLLNFDLEILYGFVKLYGIRKVVVAFQDSEAFEGSLLGELVMLFRSVANFGHFSAPY